MGSHFSRYQALNTSHYSLSLQVNHSFLIYIFPGSHPVLGHHTSCKCSETTLGVFLCLSVLNAQK